MIGPPLPLVRSALKLVMLAMVAAAVRRAHTNPTAKCMESSCLALNTSSAPLRPPPPVARELGPGSVSSSLSCLLPSLNLLARLFRLPHAGCTCTCLQVHTWNETGAYGKTAFESLVRQPTLGPYELYPALNPCRRLAHLSGDAGQESIDGG